MKRTIFVVVAVLVGLVGLGGAASAAPTCTPQDEARALRLVVNRAWSGQPIFEDLTYRNAPAVVGRCNDVLMSKGVRVGPHGVAIG